MNIHREAFIRNIGHEPGIEELTAYILMSINNENSEAKNFNPSQPRDEMGRWTTTGSGSQSEALQSIEDKIRSNKYETFVALDGGGKTVLNKKGDKNSVIMGKEEIKSLQEADNLVCTHNHPSSASFSRADLFLGSKLGAEEIRIVSDKYDYSFKPSSNDDGADWPDATNIAQVYGYHDDKIFAKYKPLVDAEKMTVNEAWHNHTHEVMENLADAYGATYIRKELE